MTEAVWSAVSRERYRLLPCNSTPSGGPIWGDWGGSFLQILCLRRAEGLSSQRAGKLGVGLDANTASEKDSCLLRPGTVHPFLERHTICSTSHKPVHNIFAMCYPWRWTIATCTGSRAGHRQVACEQNVRSLSSSVRNAVLNPSQRMVSISDKLLLVDHTIWGSVCRFKRKTRQEAVNLISPASALCMVWSHHIKPITPSPKSSSASSPLPLPHPTQ